ncbi:aldo/keto reductase [Pseudonocardia acaciae]|uniref:aldo/keto reductase n=1 Tax=Pseudonocardia acaciae TaxID=551276 RepID=UPI00055DFE57|nr:aldo/keto reductase [Pseudonocardia acaciae]
MTNLPTRPLGDTGLRISPVGFGAWAIAGPDWRYGWGAQDDDESIAAIRHAVDRGVTWIDTAPVYGLGHSERLVAKALSGIPESDRPLVFTKVGLVWDPDDRLAPPRRDMSPASVRREVEASLRRLEVDHIDLYQVHWPAEQHGPLDAGAETSVRNARPEPGTPLEEYWRVMADLKAEGKVRAIGLSNHDVAHLERAEAVAHVDTLQPPFSLINRGAAAEIAWCAARHTAVIGYSPLQSGLLTGAFTAARAAALPPDDWRRRHPDFTTDLRRNLALADALRPVAHRHGTTVAAIAVAWTLHRHGVTGAIVGARRPGQVDGWLPAATLRLDPEDLAEIRAAITHTGAGHGPACSGGVGESP